ncbi:MAG: DUF488 domain-containing protein, partial [Nitrospira sp.]|nr:DUF488 domain-containing protein [Nitrospira sp.]
MSAFPLTIWTVGHSTRPIEKFVGLLNAHGIRQLVDVRTIPKSRHNPQFNTEVLATDLAAAGIGYRHAPELGGLRKPRNNSTNTGWRNKSFQGYADYMQTDAFHHALDTLMTYGKDQKTVIMCAEAVPWRCHRSLIADALVSREWNVRHILSETQADLHRMTAFATVEEGILSYGNPA